MHVVDYSQLLWEEEGDKVLQIIYIYFSFEQVFKAGGLMFIQLSPLQREGESQGKSKVNWVS